MAELLAQFSDSALNDRLQDESITRETLICPEGTENWTTFQQTFLEANELKCKNIASKKSRVIVSAAVVILLLLAGLSLKVFLGDRDGPGSQKNPATKGENPEATTTGKSSEIANPKHPEKAVSKDELLRYYVGIGFSQKEAEIYAEYAKGFNEPKQEPATAMMVMGAFYEGRQLWDPEKVMYWHYKAAEAGSGKAMYRLHQILHPGFPLTYRGYPKVNAEKSLYWAQKAAEKNDKDGLYAMGNYCWFGARNNSGDSFIFAPDKPEAGQWWRKAAKAGSTKAEEKLAKYKDEIDRLK